MNKPSAIFVKIISVSVIFYLASKYIFKDLDLDLLKIKSSFSFWVWLGVAALIGAVSYLRAYLVKNPDVYHSKKAGLIGLIVVFALCFAALFWALSL